VYDLKHEFTGQHRSKRTLFERRRDVFRIDVGAVERNRKGRSTKYVHEWQVTSRAQIRGKAVIVQELEHARERNHAAAIEDLVTHQRYAAGCGKQQATVRLLLEIAM